MIFLFIFLLQEEKGNQDNNKLRTINLQEAGMQVMLKHQSLRTLMPFLKGEPHRARAPCSVTDANKTVKAPGDSVKT